MPEGLLVRSATLRKKEKALEDMLNGQRFFKSLKDVSKGLSKPFKLTKKVFKGV